MDCSDCKEFYDFRGTTSPCKSCPINNIKRKLKGLECIKNE